MNDPDILKIRTLGAFTMEYKGNVLDDNGSRSKKLWLLLEYLIAFRGTDISQNELIDLLWPNEDIDDPANALKAIVHRTRAVVGQIGLDGKKLIANQRGGYVWNTEGLAVTIDCDDFEAFCHKAEKARDEETRLSCLMQALEIYKGSFLPRAMLEMWAVPISTYYHTKYLAAAKEAVSLLEASRRYGDIISICQKAVVLDPYEESLHISFIRALSNIGQSQAAIAQYERVTELFYSQFGVTPSPELFSVYKDIIKTVNAAEQDISSITCDLREPSLSSSPGAFICELEVFKNIYRLELRAQERSGQVFCLSLLTVTSPNGTRPPQNILQDTMEKVAAAVQSGLRQNDVFTRFSISQFLILLAGTTLENAELAVERILRRFKSDNPRTPVIIRNRIQSVSAAAAEE